MKAGSQSAQAIHRSEQKTPLHDLPRTPCATLGKADPMVHRRFGMRWLLLVLLIVQVGLALYAGGKTWAGRDDDPQLPATTPNPSSAHLPLAIESGVNLGEEQAATWLPDATLLNVNMQVDWPSNEPESAVTSLPPGGWVISTFVAPWSQDEAEAATLSVLFDRGSGQLIGQWQTEWPKSPTSTIALPQSGIDSTTASIAAELAGGKAFRAECPRERSRTRVSLTTEPDVENSDESKLVWLINYTNSRNQNLGYRVIVDAESGEILRTEDNRIECGE
jgi:hypothetical protein